MIRRIAKSQNTTEQKYRSANVQISLSNYDVINGPMCREFNGHRVFPQRPVTRSFNVFFDLTLNKRLSKHTRRWWFETLSCSLWRHFNAMISSHANVFCHNRPVMRCFGVSVLLVWTSCCGNDRGGSNLRERDAMETIEVVVIWENEMLWKQSRWWLFERTRWCGSNRGGGNLRELDAEEIIEVAVIKENELLRKQSKWR